MAKSIKICKNCKSYKPNRKHKAFRAGNCAKGVDLFATSAIFDVRESDRCKKFSKKGKSNG